MIRCHLGDPGGHVGVLQYRNGAAQTATARNSAFYFIYLNRLSGLIGGMPNNLHTCFYILKFFSRLRILPLSRFSVTPVLHKKPLN